MGGLVVVEKEEDNNMGLSVEEEEDQGRAKEESSPEGETSAGIRLGLLRCI